VNANRPLPPPIGRPHPQQPDPSATARSNSTAYPLFVKHLGGRFSGPARVGAMANLARDS
jgi:hypothetical protein